MKHEAGEMLFADQEPDGGTFAHSANPRRADLLPARRLALIGCFRPRRCGIATFTADFHDHLAETRRDMAIDVYAMRRRGDSGNDAAITSFVDDDDPAAYRAAAQAINASAADAVWLQHEFGIFGGPAGRLILDLVDRVAAPLIVTFHTILREPSDAQRAVVERLAARAARIMVMSAYGRETLIDLYGADPASVVVIEHGAPDRPFIDPSESPLRAALGVGTRPILSTFGLIGPGKGLETAIRALPAIRDQYPGILYRIVGATHPNLVAAEGEAYRESLQRLAAELGVDGNIAWDGRFLDAGALLDQIELCDIYLAPYPNLAQITSGTLAYAVALGRAVVATPFIHARELLAGDVGLLVGQGDSDAIAEAVLLLLAVPEERRALQERAYARGRRTTWRAIAIHCAALLDAVYAPQGSGAVLPKAAPALDAVRAMSDDVGILQHGTYIVPDRAHGYCIDDNARALLLMNAAPFARRADCQALALRYASFIQHAWNPDAGAFRNFMGFDRRWLEERGSEDSNGRALWALGHCGARAGTVELRDWAAHWFARTAAIATDFKSLRAVAFALFGADEMLEAGAGSVGARALVERGGAFLHAAWKSARRSGWDWFESGLAYDNARLAEALIRAGRRLGSLPLEAAGMAALHWLCERQTSEAGHFRPVGSQGFGLAREALPFDQQPLEAWATIDACAAAFALSYSPCWARHADAAWRWFHGANDRGLPLADSASGRCCDGLTARGINRNTGAESTLAYQLAHASMAKFRLDRRHGREVELHLQAPLTVPAAA